MFERFTDQARATVVVAQEEARLHQHNYIGTEHLLLALLRTDSGAADALHSLGVELEPTRAAMIAVVGAGGSSPSGHIPFTPRSKKVLELSLREAIKLGHNHIGAEHVLLGLVREGEGLGAQLLVQQGADLERVQAAVMAELARPSDRPRPSHRSLPQTPGADGALAVARRLAAAGPVGSHHLLEALARSPQSAAARVLEALGIDADTLAAKIDELGLEGTSDLTAVEAAARRITVRLDPGDGAGGPDTPVGPRAVIELSDEATVALVTTLTDAVGGPLRGDDPVAGSLVGLWEAVTGELASLVQRVAPDAADGDDTDAESGVLAPVRQAIQGRLRRRRSH